MNTCVECGSKTTNPKFCSRSCAVKTNNRLHPKRASSRVKNRCCLYCGDILVRRQEKYCNASHQQTYQREIILKDWLDGGNPQGTELPDVIRDFLLKESYYRCTQCGWSGTNPVTRRTTLNIDHEDGDSTNNLRSNLRVLCPNCHSQTPTYGALNKGSGRKYRYGKGS